MTGGGTGDVLGAEVQGGHFIYVFFKWDMLNDGMMIFRKHHSLTIILVENNTHTPPPPKKKIHGCFNVYDL